MKKIRCKITLLTLVLLLICAAWPVTGQSAEYDEELSYQTGILLYFPNATAYELSDGNLAEVVTAGRKQEVRFKRPGDLYLTVYFDRGGNKYSRVYLIHISGHPTDETAVDRNNFAEDVLDLVNRERAKEGLKPLRLSYDLGRAAETRAHEIVKKFSHTRPNGKSCFTVIKNQGRGVGENIAAGATSPKQVVSEWMNSPGHRANIMNPDYRELGVAYVYDGYAEYRHYWVQMFRI